MSNFTPAQLDEIARAVPDLSAQANALKLKQANGIKAKLGKVGSAIVSAFTSPDVVKAEKNLAVLAATRILITIGASAGTVDLVKLILKAVGA